MIFDNCYNYLNLQRHKFTSVEKSKSAKNKSKTVDDSETWNIVIYPKAKNKNKMHSFNGKHVNTVITTNKTKRVVKASKESNSKFKSFNSDHYDAWIPNFQFSEREIIKFIESYNFVDDYVFFYKIFFTTIDDFFKFEMCLNDYICSQILFIVSHAKFNKYWFVEFDKKNMIKAIKYPLRLAAKMWITSEQTDLNEHVTRPDNAEWYFKWWGGIHCLMSEKKTDADFFMIKSSFEDFKCLHFDWKLSHRCVHQKNEFNEVTMKT